MPTNNSISTILKQFIDLQSNSLEIIKALSKTLTTNDESIDITLKDELGNEQVYKLPSINYLKNQIGRLDENIKQLSGVNDDVANIRLPNGTFSKIFQYKILKSPPIIKSLSIPTKFNTKNNWFFESFLNPILSVKFDISNYVDKNDEKIVVKRVILNTETDEQKTFFDTELKGRNDINYTELITNLYAKNILFFVDEDVVDLPLSVLRYEGSFDVLNIEEVEFNNSKKLKYILNKLTYNDNFSNLNDTVELKINDELVYNKSIFKIIGIDKEKNGVILETVLGYDSIPVGADILNFYTEDFSLKTADIQIGFDERQVIFFKVVDSDYNLTTSKWSDGVAFYSNELIIDTSDGAINLENFYRKYVIDFGLSLMNFAKEKSIPAIYGEKPDAPILNPENFKVVLINEHKLSSKEIDDINKKAKQKVELLNKIEKLNTSIESKKNELVTNVFKSEADKKAIKDQLDSLIKEKISNSNLYNSIVNELALFGQNKPATLDNPKYRIRGFFEIPEPKFNEKTGDQHVIQFFIEYRYLSLNETSSNTRQFEFKDSKNVIKRASFSNWNLIKTEIRKKVYDEKLNAYVWAEENIEDPEAININQVDIPISRGETVEIRIRSVSEAGYPLNPILSDYSNTIKIDFPQEFVSEDEATISIQKATAEQIKVQFQSELDARGLDLHLSRSTSTGDRYFAHDSDQILSGFFASDGKTQLSLFDKIKQLEDEIKSLKNKIEGVKGILNVYIIDQDGVKHRILNGTTIKLFAGYYEDLVNELPIGDRKGAIITTTYKLILENSETTPLELISKIPGSISDVLPITTSLGHSPWKDGSIKPPDPDYNIARRYDQVPMIHSSLSKKEVNTASKFKPFGFQSQQTKGQFIYCRMSDLGLTSSNYLYYEGYDLNGNIIERYDSSYNPFNRSFIADDPTTATGINATFVWDGTYDTSNANPNGNGVLTDFCIHKDHPYLNDGLMTSFLDLQYPKIKITGYINDPIFGEIPITDDDCKLPAFINSKFSNLVSGGEFVGASTNKRVPENIAKSQLTYRNNWIEYNSISPTLSSWKNLLASGSSLSTITTYPIYLDAYGSPNINYKNEYILPDKFGFIDVDRYLIGKKTCGAYLYLAPISTDQIIVNGIDLKSKRLLEGGEGSALEIPIIFQFRMTDYYGDGNTGLGIVGGYDSNATVQLTPDNKKVNITYAKKMGLDIYLIDRTFSFDIEISAKYRKDTLTSKTDIKGSVVGFSDNSNIAKNDLKNAL